MAQPFQPTALDLRILSVLQADSRLSHQEIAERVASSSSSVWRRIKAMEAAGIITAFGVSLDLAMLGLGEVVLVQVTLTQHTAEHVAAFTRLIQDTPEVLECYATTGDYDYALKVVARDIRSYHRFLSERLLSRPYIGRVNSVVVLDRLKETRVVSTAILAVAEGEGPGEGAGRR